MRKECLIIAFFLGVTGCSSSSQEITDHFEKMTEIAKQNELQCDQMGQNLNAYLAQNRTSLSNAINNVSSTKPAEAERIYMASLKLHHVLSHCNVPSVSEFTKNLSEIVLQNTVSPK